MIEQRVISQIQELRKRTYNKNVEDYLQKSKGRALHIGESVRIPQASFNPLKRMEYTMGILGYGAANRTMQDYRTMIFGDQKYANPPVWDGTPTVSQNTERLAGGEEDAFAPGKIVVDLGSGRAVALFEFARLYPQTTIIGIDNCYTESRKLNLEKPGLQLTKDDWKTLGSLPNKSVDTILSVIGVIPYGIDTKQPDSAQVVDTITRIAKPGGIFRFTIDTHLQREETQQRDFITDLLSQR
ncbi:MAG TPA: class I SAM-dependent methyltransferase [Methylomirabilota bacterium]|nr:class I SAM-dependent methyltransferase [Methylomirabilota bacterium]